MSLRNRQKKQLRRIAADMRRSDTHLSAMFNVFGKLYPDQDMPAWEQVPQESSNRAPSLSRRLACRGAHRDGSGDQRAAQYLRRPDELA
jgi:hypothetical protein